MPSTSTRARSSVSDTLQLAKARQRRNITLEQISEATKISRHFLIAIEEEDFERLPGGVFNTSYLRQYAAAIGYEAAKLLAHYHATMNAMVAPVEDAKPKRWSFSW